MGSLGRERLVREVEAEITLSSLLKRLEGTVESVTNEFEGKGDVRAGASGGSCSASAVITDACGAFKAGTSAPGVGGTKTVDGASEVITSVAISHQTPNEAMWSRESWLLGGSCPKTES